MAVLQLREKTCKPFRKKLSQHNKWRLQGIPTERQTSQRVTFNFFYPATTGLKKIIKVAFFTDIFLYMYLLILCCQCCHILESSIDLYCFKYNYRCKFIKNICINFDSLVYIHYCIHCRFWRNWVWLVHVDLTHPKCCWN